MISLKELVDAIELSTVNLSVCVPDWYNTYSGEPEYDVEFISFVDANSLVEILKDKFK